MYILINGENMSGRKIKNVTINNTSKYKWEMLLYVFLKMAPLGYMKKININI